MTFNFIYEFNPKSMSSWIRICNKTPRFPYIFVIDIFCFLFYVRRYLSIKSPTISFIFSLFACSFFDNYLDFLIGSKFSIFEHPWKGGIIIAIWFLFNFSSFDLFYRLCSFFSPLIHLMSGFTFGRNLSEAVDSTINFYPSSPFTIFFISAIISGGKYFLLSIMSLHHSSQPENLNNHSFLIIPIILELCIGISCYYWLTDLGHFFSIFWFDKEEMRLYVILFMSFARLINSLIPKSIWDKICNFFNTVFSSILPYHGSDPYKNFQ